MAWLSPDQRRQIRSGHQLDLYRIASSGRRDIEEAQAGRVFMRNLLNLRARGYPNLAVLARAHQLMTQGRPLFQDLAQRVQAFERNRDRAAFRIHKDELS